MPARHTTKAALPRTRLALAVLAAGALIPVAAGCGGDDDAKTLSKAQVIKRGGVACREAERRASKLPTPTTEHPFAKGTSHATQQQARQYLAGFADALEFSRKGLQKLDAPAQDRKLLDGYVADLGTIVAKLRAASKAEPQQVDSMANEAFGLFDKASGQTAAYGFPKGVCGSGEAS